MNGTYKVAGIDVHKPMLAVVITDAAAVGEFRFERRKFGTLDSELRALSAWLEEHEVCEADEHQRLENRADHAASTRRAGAPSERARAASSSFAPPAA